MNAIHTAAHAKIGMPSARRHGGWRRHQPSSYRAKTAARSLTMEHHTRVSRATLTSAAAAAAAASASQAAVQTIEWKSGTAIAGR